MCRGSWTEEDVVLDPTATLTLEDGTLARTAIRARVGSRRTEEILLTGTLRMQDPMASVVVARG